MTTFKSTLTRSLQALILGLTLGGAAHSAPRYELTILYPIEGQKISNAQFGINARGISVGTSGKQYVRRATIWNRHGKATALAQPRNAIFSRATGINREGTAVGAVDTTQNPDLTGLRATRWRSPDHFEILLPENGYDSDALSINDTGWIAGIRFTGSVFTAFVLSPRGRLIMPDPIAAGDDFELLDLNREHVAAGFDSGDTGTVAVRWSEMKGLEILGLLLGGTTSAAASINDRGTVAGVADDADGIYRAVRWEADGNVTQLESLEHAAYSDSQAGINDRRYCVGLTIYEGSDLADPRAQRATLWDPEGEAFDLNRLISHGSGFTLLTANGINQAGLIYGDGVDVRGRRYAYLLTPRSE